MTLAEKGNYQLLPDLYWCDNSSWNLNIKFIHGSTNIGRVHNAVSYVNV